MPTRKVKDKDGNWHQIHDYRLPRELGGANQFLQMDMYGGETKWSDYNAFIKDRPLIEQIIPEESTAFVPMNDNPTEGEYVYGLTQSGRRVKIGRITDTFKFNVGGTIMGIDEGGAPEYVYQFYDANGDRMNKVKVGDKPVSYEINGAVDRPRYYVIYDSNDYPPDYTWTIFKGDGSPLYLDFETSKYSGQGNTVDIITNHHEFCLQECTIWHQIEQMNKHCVNGCDDWYIPSINELERIAASGDFLNPEKFASQPFIYSSSTGDISQEVNYAKVLVWNPIDLKYVTKEYEQEQKGIFLPTRKF